MSNTSSNNNTRITKNTLLPYVIYNGCIFVYKPYGKKTMTAILLSIQAHQNLLCVFMAPTLSVSMMNKTMRRK